MLFHGEKGQKVESDGVEHLQVQLIWEQNAHRKSDLKKYRLPQSMKIEKIQKEDKKGK